MITKIELKSIKSVKNFSTVCKVFPIPEKEFMVEKWLDNKVLELLKQTEKQNDVTIDISQNSPKEELNQPKEFNSVKLEIVLPTTNEIEQIEYVPPQIGEESKDVSKTVNPQFKEIKPSFKLFELITPTCIPLN